MFQEEQHTIYSILSLLPFSERPGLAPSLIKCFFISNTDSFEKKSQDIELTDPRHQEANDKPPPRKEPSEVSILFNVTIEY